MAHRKTALKAKPPKRVDKRKTTSTRFRDEVRELLEGAAAQSGRSLAQEMEMRVEQSFVEEAARDREFGGKELRGLFRMMAGALEVIEQGRGKACADDWGTFQAIKEAWGTLLFMGLAPKDESFDDKYELLGKSPEDFEMSLFPIPPEYPASEQERRAYEENRVKWKYEVDEFRRKLAAAKQHFADMKSLGEITAIKMLYTGDRD